MSDEPAPISATTFRWVAGVSAAWVLVLASVHFSALWPYQLSRWAICGAALFALLYVRGWRMAVAGVIAILYNPIDPVAFGSLWPKVNALTVLGWLVLFPWGEATLKRMDRTWRWWLYPGPGTDLWMHYAALLILLVIGAVVVLAIFDPREKEKKKQETWRGSFYVAPERPYGVNPIPEEWLNKQLLEDRKSGRPD